MSSSSAVRSGVMLHQNPAYSITPGPRQPRSYPSTKAQVDMSPPPVSGDDSADPPKGMKAAAIPPSPQPGGREGQKVGVGRGMERWKVLVRVCVLVVVVLVAVVALAIATTSLVLHSGGTSASTPCSCDQGEL